MAIVFAALLAIAVALIITLLGRTYLCKGNDKDCGSFFPFSTKKFYHGDRLRIIHIACYVAGSCQERKRYHE